MTYSAKEVFLTVQGEGGQAGRPAVFLRFAGFFSNLIIARLLTRRVKVA